MTTFVVDTNVAVVANRGDTHADEQCQQTCIEKLMDVVDHGVVAVDVWGCILGEYGRHLCFSGRPGIGDAFFKHVFNYQYRDSRVKRIEVTPSDDDCRGFEELPENRFDRSDRVFLAVAVRANGIVLNATDGDWSEQAALMDELDVEVEELCPQHACSKV